MCFSNTKKTDSGVKCHLMNLFFIISRGLICLPMYLRGPVFLRGTQKSPGPKGDGNRKV